ncbi:MAG: radical SAM protein [Nitrososphaerales archaeon]
MRLRVSEIFKSIQGEGPNVGIPMTFVRLQGCNLRVPCSYCDTKYAYGPGGFYIDSLDLAARVRAQGLPFVCLTGGEPLAQSLGELVSALTESCAVEIETNGTLPPPSWYRQISTWCVDVKCPSSGVESSSIADWLSVLDSNSAIKFVVSDDADLAFAETFLETYSIAAKVYISPAIVEHLGLLEQRELYRKVWRFCVEQDVAFNFQLHKVVWGNLKGV